MFDLRVSTHIPSLPCTYNCENQFAHSILILDDVFLSSDFMFMVKQVSWITWPPSLAHSRHISDQPTEVNWACGMFDLRGHKGSWHSTLKVVSHGLVYQEPFYTLPPRGGRRDTGVSASGDAHPADKVREQANSLVCFPRLAREGKEKWCSQVWMCVTTFLGNLWNF